MPFPDTLTNLRAWWEGSDASLFTTRDDAGTLYISQIDPISPADATFTQATELDQPIYANEAVDFNTGQGAPRLAFNNDINLGQNATDVFTMSIHIPQIRDISALQRVVATRNDSAGFYIQIFNDNLSIQVQNSTIHDGAATPVTLEYPLTLNEELFITMRIDCGNDAADVKINDTDYLSYVADGTSTAHTQNTLGARADGTNPFTSEAKKLVIAQSFVTLAELTDLHNYMQGLLTTSIQIDKDGSPLQGAIVKFFEMDAFAADGADQTTVFQNVNMLSDGATQAYVTDVNGIATFTGTFDDTKVQGAMYLDNEYDTVWKFASSMKIGTENVDLTPPV